MSFRTLARGTALACALCAPLTPLATPALADTVRVLMGDYSGTLEVPMNRAVVVESDEPFAEVSIANPGIADISTLSDRTIYVLGKAPGRTTLTLLAADGRLLTNAEVQVIPDIAEFKERLRQILPNEGIEVRTANDGIVLSGTVSSIIALDRALELAQRYSPDRVSNLMGVGGTQQVMLKVRFAEMNRQVSKQLSAGLSITSDAPLSAASGSAFLGAGSVGGAGTSTLAPSLVTNSPGGQVATTFSIGGTSLSLLLEALESRGVVRTLAEPNLTALSGQEASFLAGGEYPIPVPQENGVITVEYKPFGVSLDFTPRVLDGDTINLEMVAAVSSLGEEETSGFRRFSKRETSTTVEMRDGESFAIAGLLQDDFRDANASVPFLGDLPVLGALFRSVSYEREQTELVIIVTAHLVSPTKGDNYALPTDRVRIPTERELFLFGRTEGQLPQGGVGEVARQDFGGSYGYVMD